MKMNKKGFTLAELLIVIAIIAILIAIAIPAFGAQLENARISADHANIRSAYAICQDAKILGTPITTGSGAGAGAASITGIDMDGVSSTTEININYFYTSKGDFSAQNKTDAGVIKSTVTKQPDASKCANAVGCSNAAHKDNCVIQLTLDTGATDLSSLKVVWVSAS